MTSDVLSAAVEDIERYLAGTSTRTIQRFYKRTTAVFVLMDPSFGTMPHRSTSR
jgi:hypothetical protein